MINVPNVGPYVVMVRPDPAKDVKQIELRTRPVISGTEAKYADFGDDQKEVKSERPRDVANRVEILPYKNLHFFKSNRGSLE